MIRTHSKITGKHYLSGSSVPWFQRDHAVWLLLLLCCCRQSIAADLPATGSDAAQNSPVASPTPLIPAVETNATPPFVVRMYVVESFTPLFTNVVTLTFSNYIGTNISLKQIVQAAAELQLEYRNHGYPNASIAVAPPQIADGIVTMRVFQGAIPQIVVSGKQYFSSFDSAMVDGNPPTNAPAPEPNPAVAPTNVLANVATTNIANTNVIAAVVPAKIIAVEPEPKHRLYLGIPVSAEAMEQAQEALNLKMVEVDLQERRARLLPRSGTNFLAATNAQTFEVKGYELIGNTLLPQDVMDLIFRPYIGPRVDLDLVRRALVDFQTVYHDRGYVTVSVGLPPQTLTNGIVKVLVFQGRLSEILVVNNHHFSSNNVMRALPGLHTNLILSGPIFQAELDRANANQDRQIYPQIEPGLEEKTTLLRLNVKDRFPLHAKVELNNQSSPGTPELRINSSAVYNNLWQREHSLGVQYSFSPEAYKAGDQWAFYDRPLVANYSTYYRLPLGNFDSIEDVITARPGSFGYDEGSRKFNLPPPSGRPELNVFASRSTIDTGVTTLSEKDILNVPGVISISEKDVQQDLTINSDVGARLSLPLRGTADFQSGISGGADYKTYKLTSHKTNNFLFSIITRDPGGNPNPPITATVASANPPPNGETLTHLEYLPLSLRYDATVREAEGITTFGLGVSYNPWFSGAGLPGSTNGSGTNMVVIPGVNAVQRITGSRESSGHWVILTPSLSHDFFIRTNWTLSLHAQGQWANEPLISNEQFGAGGVASVRGYSEGEVFGDMGWCLNVELKTPPQVVGIVYGKEALTIRGSVYTDYAKTYLLDPQGRDTPVSLWGCGFGGVISVGSHWDARLLFSWPLLSTTETERGQPRFNFALTGQF